jgi:hypothetical protein
MYLSVDRGKRVRRRNEIKGPKFEGKVSSNCRPYIRNFYCISRPNQSFHDCNEIIENPKRQERLCLGIKVLFLFQVSVKV